LPRLLYVTTTPAIIRNFLLPYAAHFRALGWEVHAAARGATEVPAIVEGFDSVHELPLSRSLRHPRAVLSGLGRLRALSDSLAPDIVHVHSPIAGLVTRFALGRAPLASRPAIVYTAHGFHAHPGGSRAANLVYSTMETVGGRWTDALVVINDEDERRARDWRMVAPDRLVRMPGIGIDTGHYDPATVAADRAMAFRATAGIPDGVPLVVMVAELTPAKRPLDALEALAAMARNDVHLAFLGVGRMEPRMRDLVEQRGLGERVHFCGFVEDVRPALASATASLLTSEREGLSRALMESLSMGVPVVSTDARGTAEIVGDAGFVVPVGDVAAIAAALGRMDRTSPEWARMSAEGRPRMTARYGLPGLIARHDRLYGELLGTKVRASRGAA
jgi:glycosyltransferase involved in cell wall biosynthesis